MRIGRLALVPLLALGLAGGSTAVAEDVDAAGLFASSKTAFDAHQYGKCLTDLQVLIREVGRLRGVQVAAAFPAAPQGWTLQDADTAADSVALGIMGGGSSVRREYSKEDGPRMTLSVLDVTADSPVFAGISMWLSNPAFIPPNMKVVTIKGRKGILETEGETKYTFLLNESTALFTVEGQSATKADVDALVNALDFDAIEKALKS